MSTENFTQALYAAHEYNSAVIHPQVRADAEHFLITLKASADGFALACNVLAAEPFDQLRAFWAFSTLIFHMNAVSSATTPSAIGSAADAQRVYEIMTSWIRRVVVERELPDFILNKHAHTAVIGLYAFYPDAWPTFFDDLFDFIEMRERGGGDQAVMYFLRVFEYIDEVVVDRGAQRSPAQRERDMAIKDLMREVAVRRAVDVWYNVLTAYHNRPASGGLEVAQLCLSVLQQYVEWIDVQLLLTPYWVNLLYFLMSIHPLRVGSCECIAQLAAKKQAAAVKVETLQALNVVEAVAMLAPLVTSQLPSTEEEEQFVVSVAWLMINAGEHLMTCVESGGALGATAGDMLRAVVPHILSLMSVPLLSLRDALLPFVQSYSKWAPLEELQAVMETVYQQSCRPGVAGPLSLEQAAQDGRAGDDQSPGDQGSSASLGFEERDVEHRRQMHTALRLLYRRHPQLVMAHCNFVVEQVVSCDPSSVSENDAEGALRYVYELGETVRVDQLRPPPDENTAAHDFYSLTVAILHSRIVREHSGSLVQLALFELLDRFHSFFYFSRDEVGTLLTLLLQSPQGIVNPNPRARARICYVFCHLAQSLKALFVPFVDGITDEFGRILSPADNTLSCLASSDKADLYEGLGTIFAAANALQRCGEVLGSIVVHMDEVAQSLATGSSASPDLAAAAVANCISFVTSLAKGFGGVEATRMPDSPSQGPASPPGLFPQQQGVAAAPSPDALAESEAAIATAVNGARADPTLSVFIGILEHVVELCLNCLAFGAVREKTLLCVQQLLNVLGVAALPSIEALIPSMLVTTNIIECPRLFRVLYQTVNKTRGASAVVMGRALLPKAMERVATFGDVADLRAHLNVISESAREMSDVYRQYFLFVQALVQSTAIASLQHQDIQPQISTLMSQLLGAIRTPVESELGRQAIGTISRLAAAWCDPDSGFEEYVFDSVLPTVFDELTSGAVDIRNDPKAMLLLGEVCNLLRTVAGKLGDRGLFRLYGLLTSTLPFASHTEANDYCTAVRDSATARSTMPLRQATKGLLELIYNRRCASGGAQ